MRHLLANNTDALPGIDEAYLAADEDEALIRWLIDRYDLDEQTAREEVTHA